MKKSGKKFIKAEVCGTIYVYTGIILDDNHEFITIIEDKMGQMKLNKNKIISIEDYKEKRE